MNSQEYIEVSIRFEPFSQDNAEILMAELEELPFESFEVEEPFLKCYIPKEQYSAQMLRLAIDGLEEDCFRVTGFSARLIPSANWNAKWESGFSPIIVDGKCTVKAPFHTGLRRTRFNITIEPHMAFGTGHHQTTGLMMSELLETDLTGKHVLDMGCGTSILAILAKMRGAADCEAVDIDEWCVRNSLENIALNHMEHICVRQGDASVLKDMGPFDVILANINRNILLRDMNQYVERLVPGGELLISGFYDADVPLLTQEAEKLGLKTIRICQDKEWTMIRFRQN